MTDLPGKAIFDFHFNSSRSKLFVHDTFGPKVQMPVSTYFRNFKKMPEIETTALKLCEGKILDVGAGSGSHALELQKMGKQVDALEISAFACKVMLDRGVNQVIHEDFFKLKNVKYDTILLLMNGIGICGDLVGFESFLGKASELLNEDGKIIFDSCDISYMYEDIQKPLYYFGEVKCRYEYEKDFTEWFKWLYLDFETMKSTAEKLGWKAELLCEDENDQYLASLSRY